MARPQPASPSRLNVPSRLLAAGTLGIAALAAVLALVKAYDAAVVVGLLGLLVGGWAQMVSATTRERCEAVTGAVVAGVALGIGLANGSGIFT
ncbi:MAG: hypothetical protein ACR2K2_12565 [Mycobacteriales bacterium]